MIPEKYLIWVWLVIWEKLPETEGNPIFRNLLSGESENYSKDMVEIANFIMTFYPGLSGFEQNIYSDLMSTGLINISNGDTRFMRTTMGRDLWNLSYWPPQIKTINFEIFCDRALELNYCKNPPDYPECWAIRKARENLC